MKVSKMKIFLVGGFLGSGKTTAILRGSEVLQKSGKTAAVVTNDQGDQLVDTLYLGREEMEVREVTGGCFFCRYQDLEEQIRSLEEALRPEAIFAESVGSCTDLVATVLRPLEHFSEGKLEVVLSVFADVRLLADHCQQKADLFGPDVLYIYEKQLEEADIIVVNKTDLLRVEALQEAKESIEEVYGGKTILYLSALSEEDIRKWIETLFRFGKGGAMAPLSIDYGRYGDGEAALAWLDGEIGIDTPGGEAVKAGMDLILRIYGRIEEKGYPIGHLKFLLSDGFRQKKISYTTVALPVNTHYPSDFEAERIVVLVNARVQAEPEELKRIVEESILETEALNGCRITEGAWSSFKPGYPRPTHRMI